MKEKIKIIFPQTLTCLIIVQQILLIFVIFSS